MSLTGQAPIACVGEQCEAGESVGCQAVAAERTSVGANR